MKTKGLLKKFFLFDLLKSQIGMERPLRIAFLSILLWSTLSFFMSKGTKLTDFSAILFPAFSISSLFLLFFKVFYEGEDFIYDLIKPILKKWRHFLIGSSLIFGSHLFFYWGIQKGPKVESNLTNFLWPLIFIILGYLLFNEKFLNSEKGKNFINKIKLFLGNGSLVVESEKTTFDLLKTMKVIIGFLGVTLLLTHGQIDRFNVSEWQGPILGFLGGFLWAIFSIYLRFLGNKSYIALFINGTTILSGVFWIYRGCYNIFPTLWIAVYLGLLPLGLAMLSWERAMKYGRTQEIGTLAFLAPLLSSIFLFFAKYDYINMISLIGGCLIIISNINCRDIINYVKNYLLQNDKLYYSDDLNAKDVLKRLNILIVDSFHIPTFKYIKIIVFYFIFFILFFPLKKLNISISK